MPPTPPRRSGSGATDPRRPQTCRPWAAAGGPDLRREGQNGARGHPHPHVPASIGEATRRPTAESLDAARRNTRPTDETRGRHPIAANREAGR